MYVGKKCFTISRLCVSLFYPFNIIHTSLKSSLSCLFICFPDLQDDPQQGRRPDLPEGGPPSARFTAGHRALPEHPRQNAEGPSGQMRRPCYFCHPFIHPV